MKNVYSTDACDIYYITYIMYTKSWTHKTVVSFYSDALSDDRFYVLVLSENQSTSYFDVNQ